MKIHFFLEGIPESIEVWVDCVAIPNVGHYVTLKDSVPLVVTKVNWTYSNIVEVTVQ